MKVSCPLGIMVPAIICAFSMPVLAAQKAPAMQSPTWYAEGFLGNTRGNIGKTQDVPLIAATGAGNRYVAQSNEHNAIAASLGVGYLKNFSHTQVGIGVSLQQMLGSLTNKGEVWQGYSSNFNNLTYQYKVSATVTSIVTEIAALTFSKKWQPYIKGGIGLSRNKSYGYSEQSTVSGAAPMTQGFVSKTVSRLAYSLGAGVRMRINDAWQLLGEVDYANLGTSGLGLAPTQTTNNTITTHSINISSVMLGLRYNWHQ